jgi:transcription elongation factor Elf1
MMAFYFTCVVCGHVGPGVVRVDVYAVYMCGTCHARRRLRVSRPVAPTRATTIPTDPTERKRHPVASGVLDYFPDALVAIARVSWQGTDQHNPGQPLHWAREKSTDEADALMRHFLQRGGRDSDGMRHTAKLAWRALAMLQKELEAEAK